MTRGQKQRVPSGRQQARAFTRALAAVQPRNGAEAARRLDIPAKRWRAKDVPKLRDGLLKAWPVLLEHILNSTPNEKMHLPVERRDMELGLAYFWSRRDWQDFLMEQLPGVEMFYVDAETTDLVAQAAAAKPRYQLWEDKLPADAGLMVFEHPYCAVPPEQLAAGQRVELVAALWFKVADTGIGGEGEPVPGVMLVTLQDTGVLLWTQPIGEGVVATRAEAERVLTRLVGEHGPLSYHEEYPLPFGDRPWGDHTPDVGLSNTAVGAALTAWILMHQRLTEVREEPPPRHLVERAAKTGQPRPKGVRVVTMRAKSRRANPRQERREGEASRTYSVRWPVTGYGYWRNTWYPSRGRHEEQFIEVPGYIKGPEGAPLIHAERVNVLRSR